MDITFCEDVIIKFLFQNEQLRERTITFIKPEIFDEHNNIVIVKIIKEFYGKYNKMPSITEMKMELPDDASYKKLTDIMNLDLTGFSNEYLLDECQVFMRQKLSINCFFECTQHLKEAKFAEAGKYPDILRESLAFSFNTDLGLCFLEDEERIYNFLHNTDKVVPFGLTFLDRNTKGGAHEKSLVLFLAETNLGKTLILSSLASNNIKSNKKVLYITCEMSEDKICERVLANVWDHNINDLGTINREVFFRRFEDMKASMKGRLEIKEYPPSTINANDIRNLIKEYEVKKKFKPDIIYLDYLELVRPSFSRKSDNSYTDCKRVSEEIRAIAVEHGIPIVSAVQSNRDGMGKSELSMKNTADSVGIAFTGDIVFGVTQSPELLEAGKFSIQILKNRYGLNKLKCLINVDKPKMTISDSDEDIDTVSKCKRPANSTTPKHEIKEAMDLMKDTMANAKKASDEIMFGEWQ